MILSGNARICSNRFPLSRTVEQLVVCPRQPAGHEIQPLRKKCTLASIVGWRNFSSRARTTSELEATNICEQEPIHLLIRKARMASPAGTKQKVPVTGEYIELPALTDVSGGSPATSRSHKYHFKIVEEVINTGFFNVV